MARARGPSATGRDSGFRPTGPTQTARVVRVVDGDTIIVRIGGRDERLRYIGMDTPETVKPDTPVQWMGPEASRANAALVAGQNVVLEKDVSETDRYGRLLRYVWLYDGARWTLVDLELVAEGFAQVETDPPDVKYAGRFVAAERAARSCGARAVGSRAVGRTLARGVRPRARRPGASGPGRRMIGSMTFVASPRSARVLAAIRFLLLAVGCLLVAHDAVFAAEHGLGAGFAQAMRAGGHDAYWPAFSVVAIVAATILGLRTVVRLGRLGEAGAGAADRRPRSRRGRARRATPPATSVSSLGCGSRWPGSSASPSRSR